ncbi:hypothetical protein QMK33_17760 [Hymenobacter sp. H14-R3]|uniref:DUF7674 family protein n=1 Tax=Hymenobacter sp. H14-R3 TaxID=3046308 RepID=UPI0024B952F8|nr:hypothetical protein [Hymenobacter sp. H14-R3]MDJ0366999.1 hypothetical protein [Hymenobacter sp. H14-R3]
MTSLETADLLTAEFPELSADLHAPNMLGSVYRQLDCFAAFTRRAFATGRLEVLRHCFAVADSLLRRADRYLTNAINNVYLHGLHLDGSTADTHLARQLMPVHLYAAYCYPHTNMLP